MRALRRHWHIFWYRWHGDRSYALADKVAAHSQESRYHMNRARELTE